LEKSSGDDCAVSTNFTNPVVFVSFGLVENFSVTATGNARSHRESQPAVVSTLISIQFFETVDRKHIQPVKICTSYASRFSFAPVEEETQHGIHLGLLTDVCVTAVML